MSTTEALATIHKTITVDAPLETAFETFTRRMDSWWPRGSHSLFDEREAVVFEERVGGRLYERSRGGEDGDWADVIAWEPPHRFVLRWRVNPKAEPTELEVRFIPENGGTGSSSSTAAGSPPSAVRTTRPAGMSRSLATSSR